MSQSPSTTLRWVDAIKNCSTLDEADLQPLLRWLYGIDHQVSAEKRIEETADEVAVPCFKADFFHGSPESYQTNAVHVMKSYHHYGNSFRAEMLSVSASRPLCVVLAMLALQAVFTAKPIELHLTHAESGIQKIYFELQEQHYPLEIQAVAWHYEVESVREYMQELKAQGVKFNFCLSGEDFARQGHWLDDRNHVYCVGTARELSAWAGVLLNIAHPDNAKDEIGFECDVGFGGVHAGSAELYLYLPTSLGYALENSEYKT